MRKDGILLKNIDPMRKLMPYLFKSRNGNIVYSPEEIEFDFSKDYLRNLNKSNPSLKIGTFELIITALIRTFAMYPYLNRFVANKKIYARNNFSLCFVVLKLIDGKYVESTAKVFFNKTESIFEVSKKINDAIELSRSNVVKDDDKLMSFFANLPSPILTFSAWAINNLIHIGVVPKKITDAIPLFSSVYISNLGSIGHNTLHHHLFEWGTTSIFLTMGKITKRNDKSFLNVVFSVDERIADGIYLVKALRYFSKLLKHPEALELPLYEIVEDDGI